MTEVLLGTVAIEPNRWGTVTPDRSPVTRLASWLDTIADAGFDGLEVWDGHLTKADATDADAIADGPLPVPVFNSYADFGPGGEAAAARVVAARWAGRIGARAVKFNVGNDPDDESGYVERIATWLGALPGDTVALCECHQGISIAETPAVATRIFEQAGAVERVQALVHTHDGPDLVRAKFDAYGERITHVHVNFLDFDAMQHPTLASCADRLADFHALVTGLGFAGSWTLEFVAGLLTDRDEPGALLEQAAADLPVLRSVLDG